MQAARLRLERKKLEGHATRLPKEPGSAAAEAQPQVESAKEAKVMEDVGFPAKAETAVAERVGVTVRVGRALVSLCRWADRHPWAAILIVQVVVVACYFPAFYYEGYKMDDTVAIQRNPNVVDKEVSLEEFMRRDYWGLPMHGSGWTNKSFRPLTTLTFRWNYLLHGLASCGFFVTNILLHCAASALLGATALAIGLSGALAALAALVFGIHPVHTENVLYLVGRADILAAMLGLLSLVLYSFLFCPAQPLQVVKLCGPRKGWASNPTWLVFPTILVALSGLCKETGFTLYALFMGMELLDFIDVHTHLAQIGQRIHFRAWRRIRNRVGLLVTSTFLVFVMRYRQSGGTKLNMSPQDNPISFETIWRVRALSYFYLHGVYTRLLVWPQFLCYDYSMDAIPAVRTPLDCRLLLPFAAYTLIFGAVAAGLRAPTRYRRAAMISLALLVVPMLPASNIMFPVGTVIGERLLYIPSAGFCLAVVVALDRAYGSLILGVDDGKRRNRQAEVADGEHIGSLSATPGKPKRGGRATSRERRRPNGANGLNTTSAGGAGDPTSPMALAAIGTQDCRRLCRLGSIGGVVLVVLTVRCMLRVRTWESSDSLFINDGEIQPTSSKVQFNLGITYMQMQEWDLAVDALVRCAYADPLSSLPFYRIGQIEIMRSRFDTAEKYLAAAIDKFGASMMVKDEEVFHDLSLAMFMNGKIEQAETRLRVALQLNPDFAKGWANLACCIAQRDMYDATRAARKAVSLAPENPQYWANLAVLARHTQDPATASGAWARALELWPDMPEHKDCAWEFAPSG